MNIRSFLTCSSLSASSSSWATSSVRPLAAPSAGISRSAACAVSSCWFKDFWSMAKTSSTLTSFTMAAVRLSEKVCSSFARSSCILSGCYYYFSSVYKEAAGMRQLECGACSWSPLSCYCRVCCVQRAVCCRLGAGCWVLAGHSAR